MKHYSNLYNNDVDIWFVNQDILPIQASFFFKQLCKEEQKRANAFYFEKDKRHFIASRYALRQILGQYLQTEPSDLQFSYSKFEKPSLIDFDIHFNVSHSYGKALIAVAKNPVGIDIEWSLREVELKELAQRFFSCNEAEQFLKLEDSVMQRYFFNIWTKKEAVIKAIGDGLSYPLDRFHVGIQADNDTLYFDDIEIEKKPWSLKTVHLPQADYVAALAVKGDINLVKLKSFEFLNKTNALFNP